MNNFLLKISRLWGNGYLIDGCMPYEYNYYHKIYNASINAKNKTELKRKLKNIKHGDN